MPVTPTYPGVYIEEVPSEVRTIVGVATSITAFIGRARRGPVNKAVTINNFGDYGRTFGGLWDKSTMSYAVRDFYLNGGAQAIIVRLYHPYFATEDDRNEALEAAQTVADAATGANASEAAAAAETAATGYDTATEHEKVAAHYVADAAADAAAKEGATAATVQAAAQDAVGEAAPVTKARLRVGVTNRLYLEAANEGAWGNNLQAEVTDDVSEDLADSWGLETDDLFNLTVTDTGTGVTELLRNVTVAESPRRVDKVLENESSLVRMRSSLPADRPEASEDSVTGDDLASDGSDIDQSDFIDVGGTFKVDKKGLYALEQADLFNLLCLPPYSFTSDIEEDDTLWSDAATYCEDRRAMLLIDAPGDWTSKGKAILDKPSLVTSSKNAAIFFPRLKQPNPLRDNQKEDFAPCGAVAGVFARTDTERGVWKAPAGLAATLRGVPELSVPLTDAENGELNPLGLNCLRAMPAAGRVIWGSRTLQGDDRLASEWKYIPVRRLALYIEESLYRGTHWVVFEPNDEPLWAQIRLNVGAFMHNLFRQGAFQGTTPRDAYFVKCDKETTTQNDINLGIVNILVGFAPLKPAEFVIIKISQSAGEIIS
jgi:hypothetical protein